MLSKAAELVDDLQIVFVLCVTYKFNSMQIMQEPGTSLGPEVTAALTNLGTGAQALQLLCILAKHGEYGRRASNEIAETLLL